MTISFTKMHSAGNDYIFIDMSKNDAFDAPKASKILSIRHFSIGSDGIILIFKSSIYDAEIIMYNADGSEGTICGNGLRCVGKYLYDNSGKSKKSFIIGTSAGIKTVDIHSDKAPNISYVIADMGKYNLTPYDSFDFEQITYINIGNEHAVVFVNDTEHADLNSYYNAINSGRSNIDEINVEICTTSIDSTIHARVMERGSGETLSCGSGACAIAASLIKRKIKTFEEWIPIVYTGGELDVKITKNGSVFLGGDVIRVYEGEIEYNET